MDLKLPTALSPVGQSSVPKSPELQIPAQQSPELHSSPKPQVSPPLPLTPETLVPLAVETSVPLAPEISVALAPETPVPLAPETPQPLTPVDDDDCFSIRPELVPLVDEIAYIVLHANPKDINAYLADYFDKRNRRLISAPNLDGSVTVPSVPPCVSEELIRPVAPSRAMTSLVVGLDEETSDNTQHPIDGVADVGGNTLVPIANPNPIVADNSELPCTSTINHEENSIAARIEALSVVLTEVMEYAKVLERIQFDRKQRRELQVSVISPTQGSDASTSDHDLFSNSDERSKAQILFRQGLSCVEEETIKKTLREHINALMKYIEMIHATLDISVELAEKIRVLNTLSGGTTRDLMSPEQSTNGRNLKAQVEAMRTAVSEFLDQSSSQGPENDTSGPSQANEGPSDNIEMVNTEPEASSPTHWVTVPNFTEYFQLDDELLDPESNGESPYIINLDKSNNRYISSNELISLWSGESLDASSSGETLSSSEYDYILANTSEMFIPQIEMDRRPMTATYSSFPEVGINQIRNRRRFYTKDDEETLREQHQGYRKYRMPPYEPLYLDFPFLPNYTMWYMRQQEVMRHVITGDIGIFDAPTHAFFAGLFIFIVIMLIALLFNIFKCLIF